MGFPTGREYAFCSSKNSSPFKVIVLTINKSVFWFMFKYFGNWVMNLNIFWYSYKIEYLEL